jgi:glycosyltransferase involved in cell wall biosynthesis
MIPWVKALQEAGAKVSMDVLVQGKTEDHSLLQPVHWDEGRFSRVLSTFKKSKGVNKPYVFPNVLPYWRYLKQLNPDIVVVRDPSRYFSRLVMLFSLFLPFRLVLYNQAPLLRSTSIHRRLMVRIINFCFRANWMTPVMGDQFKGFKPLPGHYFVPFAAEWIGRQPKHREETWKILGIGKFERRKEQLTLLKALVRLNSIIPNWHLTWVGELSNESHQAWYEEIVRFIDENKLFEKVKFVTNQPPSDMSVFYSLADVMVLPSRNEPASVSVIEALAHGLPVICSHENGTACYIIEGKNGAVFKAGDEESLVAALEKIYAKLNQHPTDFQKEIADTSQEMINPKLFLAQFSKLIG